MRHLKRPLILGIKGNMGSRYSAILRNLNVHYLGADVGDELPSNGRFDSVIIATPTFMHLHQIRRFYELGVPILCEKPISTDYRQALELCDDADQVGAKLRMVNQYAKLVCDDDHGDSRYDYWKTGRDGLAWDCISILGLAKGAVHLADKSAVWSCKINGRELSLADMDGAYVKMIECWLGGDHSDIDYIRKAHLKVQEYLSCHPQQ